MRGRLFVCYVPIIAIGSPRYCGMLYSVASKSHARIVAPQVGVSFHIVPADLHLSLATLALVLAFHPSASGPLGVKL